jgi:DNA helicase MCM8
MWDRWTRRRHAMQVCSAKGALTARMPARTTVIAAANPVGGVYVRAKSLQENAKMSSALFSRFDLTFGLTDDADAEQDQHLSAHVMHVHCKGGTPAARITCLCGVHDVDL